MRRKSGTAKASVTLGTGHCGLNSESKDSVLASPKSVASRKGQVSTVFPIHLMFGKCVPWSMAASGKTVAFVIAKSTARLHKADPLRGDALYKHMPLFAAARIVSVARLSQIHCS